MKKIILTVVTLAFVAVVVQAQSPRAEVLLTRNAFNGTFAQPTRAQVAQRQTRQTALERLVLKQVEQAKPQHSVTQSAAAHPAAAKPTTRQPQVKTGTRSNTNRGSASQWLKAIFLGGRFPGESVNAYHDRLSIQSHPSALPFK